MDKLPTFNRTLITVLIIAGVIIIAVVVIFSLTNKQDELATNITTAPITNVTINPAITNTGDGGEITLEENFIHEGNIQVDKNLWQFTLVYGGADAPALTANLIFDYQDATSLCTIDGQAMPCQEAINGELIVNGDHVSVTGNEFQSGTVAVFTIVK